MITVISPAKTMDFESKAPSFSSRPISHSESESLVNCCKALTLEQIKGLMSVSDKIAKTNYKRFQMFYDNISPENRLYIHITEMYIMEYKLIASMLRI
ncbi:peroxide stress protein YaaA [Rickettsiaceae bacterium]|nr:peroxide stress protein YaaA [Rickettsiaceae bacterium]